MADFYLASLLLMAGVCLAFGVHACSLAARGRERHYLDLMAIAVLQAGYCGVTYQYFRQATPAHALPYGQWICVVTPYLTFFFGQLVVDLLQDESRWLRRFQPLNLLLTTLFVGLVLSDWALGSTLALTGEVVTELGSRHRHRLFFAGLGQAYLLWVSMAFTLFSYALFRRFRVRPELRPMMFGCIAYFACTTADFGILLGWHDFYFVQHFGFFVLVCSCWLVVASHYDRSVARLQELVLDLQEQRRKLLRSPQVVQQQRLNALGTLAAGVAHEVNNPLQGVMGCADLICEQLPPGTPCHTLAERVVNECARVAETVRGLLRFARQDEDLPCRVELGELIHDVRTLFQTVLARDGITLHVEVAPGLPVIYGQPRQLSQVLMNLLTNARDAVNARRDVHPREIHLRAETVSEGGAAWVAVTVRDSGTGVDPASADRIFDPFYTTKGVGEGTGLGLSISHGIVTAHGGQLQFESQAGAGACFWFHLPVRPEPPSRPSSSASYAPESPSRPHARGADRPRPRAG